MDRFKQRLDVSLALCGSCQAKAESVIDQQNRSLMYDIASDTIFKTKHRPSEDSFRVDAETDRRQYYLRTSAKIINLLLVVVAVSLSAALYARNYQSIRLSFSAAPSLTALPSFLLDLFSRVHPFSLALVFVGVFLALASVSLKNEARVFVGYLDLLSVMSWLAWLVVQLIVGHALQLPVVAAKVNWIARRIETVVYPTIVAFALASSIANCVATFLLKPKTWRLVNKLTRQSVGNTTSSLVKSSPLGICSWMKKGMFRS